VRGLTTAASIWVTAAIGMAVGFGYYTTAVVATVAVVLVLILIRPIELRFIRNRRNRRRGDPRSDELSSK